MTNKPMLSVERELLERFVSDVEAHNYGFDGLDEMRALLDNQTKPFECLDGGKCGIGGYCDACPHTKPAAQQHGEPVAWRYCPECGSEELHHECGEHKQCKKCHQEWFSDIDYSEVVRGNLQKLKAEQPAPVAVVIPEILHSTIRDTLRNYRMSTLDDGHGGGYPLIDAMTADGRPVSGGIEECQYLADAILNACSAEVARLNGVKP